VKCWFWSLGIPAGTARVCHPIGGPIWTPQLF